MFKTYLSRGSLATAFLVVGLAKTYAQETSPRDVTGRWQVIRALKDGCQEFSTLDLKQSGPDVSGAFVSHDGEATTIQDGKLVGASLTFSFLYATRHLDVSGQILSDNKIDLTITSRGRNETFQAIAERKETSSAGAQPLNRFPFLPAPMTSGPLTTEGKLSVYVHRTFGPPALILPAFGASFSMLNPPSHYPREWKDGAQAFGRHYGNTVAPELCTESDGLLRT